MGGQTSNKKMIAIKGFDKDWKCRGFQFQVGETYEHDGPVEICESGFHAVEYPLDVFTYYSPADSRYAIVELSGETDTHEQDSKIAAARITIKEEIDINEIAKSAVDWIMSKVGHTKSATEDRSAATNTGHGSATTNTGYGSTATNTGYVSVATNTGHGSTATNTGDRSTATNTGHGSAATNTGDRSVATNTGYGSAAEVSGKGSVALNIGYQGKAKASGGGAIVLCYHDDDGNLIHIRASKVGENGIKPDTYYRLNAEGEFEEVKNKNDAD